MRPGRQSLTRRSTNRYYGTGLIFGKMLCIIIFVDYILLAFLDFFYPRENIDLAPKFELARWQEVRVALDHSSSRVLTLLWIMQMCEEEADRAD